MNPARHTPLIALLLLATATVTGARIVDTTIIADGSPGPYVLGNVLVDTGSIVVTSPDTSRELPAWVFVPKTNGILFSDPVDSATTLQVHYATVFHGLQKQYSLYRRTYLAPDDTSAETAAHQPDVLSMLDQQDQLLVSGYKSVGVSLGSQGQMNLEQALDVRVSGLVAPETKLSANLSDQGTSFEGATREIGELDMIYITLESPRYHLSVGDRFVHWLDDGLLSNSKKIKGLSAGITRNQLSLSAFGALAGGKHAVETFQGRLGFQGPYQLHGQGEADLITPVGGTVRVWVQGSELREGIDADYIIDYELATLTFTPRFPVRDDHLIRVEYEYKSFDYQRLSTGMQARIHSPDSSLEAHGIMWMETDNRNHTIDPPVELERAKPFLRGAGDSLPRVPTARRIDPHDVLETAVLEPVYRAVADDSGGVYYEYEPSPQPGQELYRVWFSQTSPAEGDYVRQTDTIQGRGVYYYRHVGQGNGSYTARATVPAPERKVTGEFVARYNPTEWASLDVDVAGEDHDRNLFSSIDDADNRAAASRTRFRLGRKRLDSASAWVSGTHQYVSRGFSREILPAWEARRQWDRENELFPGAQRNLWDLTLGGTIIPGLSTAINYGQFIQEHQLITDRVSNTTGYTLSDALHLEYTGDYLRHLTAQGAGRLRRGDATARLELDRAVLRLSFDDEWKHIDTDEQIRGSMGAGVNLELPSLHLTEEVYYARRFRDKRSLARSLYRHRRLPADTGAVFYWTQKITRSPRESWQLSASSSWQYQRELQDTITALLISAASDLTSPRTGIATRHELRVSSERTSMYVQVPVYAGGAGLGDYSLDSVTQEYYYNPRRGDTYIYEREVYDTTGSNRTRKAFFGWDWRFEPPPGVFEGVLLGDITWNGALSLEEHVVNRPDEPARYWLPGFLTLNRTSKDDSLVSLADISYRQEAEWSRDSIEGLSVELFTQPAIRKVRGYTEREMSLGIEADYEIGDWRLGFDARQLRLRHRPSSHGYSEGFSFVDRHAVLSQQWRLPLSLRLFCEETGGYARRWFTGSSGEDGDGYYALLRPGIAFEPMDKGHAEASYSFARVNIPGMLDYRMARGYESGTSHRIELSANIDAGERFTITGLYFGELSRGLDEDDYGRALHTVSMEVKAQL